MIVLYKNYRIDDENIAPMEHTENQKQWEKFAAENALFYIDTNSKNYKQFWEKGLENFKKYIFPIITKYSINRNVAMDFGCGIGRNAFPITEYFKITYGVDISEKMLEQARLIAAERKINNIKFIQNDELSAVKKPVDFIYCANVFQHIEDASQIEKIVITLSRLLRGYAYLHFDTRPPNLLYYLKKLLPDFLLPRSQRRGIRRIRRQVRDIKNIFINAGLSIIEESNKNSEYHFFLLGKN